MRKINSTNYQNELSLMEDCPFNYTLKLIGNRWRASILWKISHRIYHYAALQEALPQISKKMLSQELKKLVVENMLDKELLKTAKVKRTKYHLTEKGSSLIPILSELYNWGTIKQKEEPSTMING
jgi:DNA-binding HxlR family transcriptional regulator